MIIDTFMNRLSRRSFLIANATTCLGVWAKNSAADITAKKEVVLHLFANGGWDVASFCDPKMNINSKINSWADKQETAQAGSIMYAPIGDNADFFTRHHAKILVVNGINAKTNVHSAGRSMSLTGLSKNGASSICALHAATQGASMPMPLLGNAFETGGIVAATQINGGLIQVISTPSASDQRYLSVKQWEIIDAAVDQSSRNNLNDKNSLVYQNAIRADQSLYSNIVNLTESLTVPPYINSAAINDMKFTLAAFATGASAACDYSIYGFDTHDNHDKRQLSPLKNLTQTASVAWDFAEQLGIDDRLTVIISSEFSRTPYYNDVAGKDHWPFSSLIIMKKNALWTNKVVGRTDEKLVGLPMDLPTATYSPSGTVLEPGHIHSVLRKYLGINPAFERLFPLYTRSDLKLFG